MKTLPGIKFISLHVAHRRILENARMYRKAIKLKAGTPTDLKKYQHKAEALEEVLYTLEMTHELVRRKEKI